MGVLESGMPTGVGSLPFIDPLVAATAELELHPELPAAPQLPRRDLRETMLAQVALGIPGIDVDGDGALRIDGRRLTTPAPDDGLEPAAWAGVLAFLSAASGRTGPLKLQLTGPVTLGLALMDGGVRAAKAFAIASVAVRTRVTTLLETAARYCPSAKFVVVLDEPMMSRAMHPGFPLAPEETVDLLSGGLASATSAGAAVHGVHCCGRVDWSLVLHAGPDLVSMPATPDVVQDAASLALFLERGGWVAWGVVPTDKPFGERYESHWHRLNDVWKGLAAGGCDPVRLRTQSLITPACGLALHDEPQVPVIMNLVRKVAERVQDQAYAARMSVGA